MIISACLAGASCAYDGGHRRHAEIFQILEDHPVLPLCPEQLGGMPTPRDPAEISGGDGSDVLAKRARVITSSGGDVTGNFVRGARETTALARQFGCASAILKPHSPACSPEGIYDGTFSGCIVGGCGVAARALNEVVRVILTPDQLLQCPTDQRIDGSERG